MNKKNVSKFVALNIMGSMLLSHAAFGRLTSTRATSGGSSSGVGGSSASGRAVPTQVSAEAEAAIHKGVAGKECNMDANKSEYLPLDIFKDLTADGSLPVFEQRAGNIITVKMPAVLTGCGKFVPQIIQSPDSPSDVTIAMTIESSEEYKVAANGAKPEYTIKGNTYGGLIKCMELKGYLKNGNVSHADISPDNYSEYPYSVDYAFDKVKDVKQTLKLSYGYPVAFKTNGYGPSFGLDSDVRIPSTKCMIGEMIATTPTLLNKGQDILLQELASICKNGTAQQIADARRSIGNADALKDIAEKLRADLDAGYLVAVQKDVERITTAMDKLENQINSEKDTMDEKTAKTVVRKYADLARELDSLYLSPAVKHLDELMTARAAMDDGEARDKVDEEIRVLNQNIGKFSSRNQTAFSNLYGLMEKYALNDSAKNIEDIRLKSYLYSRVFAGSNTDRRGTPLTFEQANQKQVSVMQSFEKTMGDWTDQYLAGQGNTYPLKKTEKERTAAVNRMNSRWQTYQQNEQKTYNKYCTGIFGASNPVQCRAFMAGAEQRRANEVKKYQKDNQYVGTRDAKLARLGGNYDAYQRATVEQRTREAENASPYGSSYTSFDDNFSDAYPLYQGPAAGSSSYDAWRTSMTGQSPQQGQQQYQQGQQGQQQFQFQQPQYPVNYGQQVQQGQYQMPQQQGWASM